MIKNVIEHIGGVGVYGIISVCLFFAFFAGMVIWSLRLKKSYLELMGRLPLDDTPAANRSVDVNSNPDEDHE